MPSSLLQVLFWCFDLPCAMPPPPLPPPPPPPPPGVSFFFLLSLVCFQISLLACLECALPCYAVLKPAHSIVLPYFVIPSLYVFLVQPEVRDHGQLLNAVRSG